MPKSQAGNPSGWPAFFMPLFGSYTTGSGDGGDGMGYTCAPQADNTSKEKERFERKQTYFVQILCTG